MPHITLRCPNGHIRRVGIELAGATLSCVECGHQWRIPAAPGAFMTTPNPDRAEKDEQLHASLLSGAPDTLDVLRHTVDELRSQKEALQREQAESRARMPGRGRATPPISVLPPRDRPFSIASAIVFTATLALGGIAIWATHGRPGAIDPGTEDRQAVAAGLELDWPTGTGRLPAGWTARRVYAEAASGSGADIERVAEAVARQLATEAVAEAAASASTVGGRLEDASGLHRRVHDTYLPVYRRIISDKLPEWRAAVLAALRPPAEPRTASAAEVARAPAAASPPPPAVVRPPRPTPVPVAPASAPGPSSGQAVPPRPPRATPAPPKESPVALEPETVPKCTICQGSGRTRCSYSDAARVASCVFCEGEGTWLCVACDGSGRHDAPPRRDLEEMLARSGADGEVEPGPVVVLAHVIDCTEASADNPDAGTMIPHSMATARLGGFILRLYFEPARRAEARTLRPGGEYPVAGRLVSIDADEVTIDRCALLPHEPATDVVVLVEGEQLKGRIVERRPEGPVIRLLTGALRQLASAKIFTTVEGTEGLSAPLRSRRIHAGAASGAPPIVVGEPSESAEKTPAEASAYASRLAERRKLLARCGGSAATESSVLAGLRWLARHQGADGGWHGDAFSQGCAPDTRPCGGPGYNQFDAGLTGLALLAFLGAGYTERTHETYEDPYTHANSDFGLCVGRGLTYLASVQDEQGCFGPPVGEFMYNHAIATAAVAEAYALTGGQDRGAAARRGADFLVSAQNLHAGWRYTMRAGDNDTSVTGWCVMALKSVGLAGLPHASVSYAGANAWVDSVTDEYGEVGYNGRGKTDVVVKGKNEAWGPHPSMTAIAMLCRIFGDRSAGDPGFRRQAAFLLRDLPRFEEPAQRRPVDFYYWYYGTLALFQFEGPEGAGWKTWNEALKTALCRSQKVRRDRCEDGSWDPSVDRWGFAGGRIYATALNTLTLETYYRYERTAGTSQEAAVPANPAETNAVQAAVRAWLTKRKDLRCSACSGSGARTCNGCSGRGYVVNVAVGSGGGAYRAPCGACAQRGQVGCADCRTAGFSRFRLKEVLFKVLPAVAQRSIDARLGSTFIEYLIARRLGQGVEAAGAPFQDRALAERLYEAWANWMLPLRSYTTPECRLEGQVPVGALGQIQRATARYTVKLPGGADVREETTWVQVDGAWRLLPPAELLTPLDR